VREVAGSSTVNVVTSGSELTEAAPWAGAPGSSEAKGEALAKKQAKRKRQQSIKSEETKSHALREKMTVMYSTHLRIAHATYVKILGDYYGSDEGVWQAPPPEIHYDVNHCYRLAKSKHPKGQDEHTQSYITEAKKTQKQTCKYLKKLADNILGQDHSIGTEEERKRLNKEYGLKEEQTLNLCKRTWTHMTPSLGAKSH